MRRSRVVLLSLVLASVGVGCYKFIGFPNYGRPIVIAVVIQKDKNKCITHTSPQWQPVMRGEKFYWHVVAEDACAKPSDVTFQFEKSDAVRVKEIAGNQKEGEAVGACGRYKYKVLISTKVVEDPEIEIWP